MEKFLALFKLSMIVIAFIIWLVFSKININSKFTKSDLSIYMNILIEIFEYNNIKLNVHYIKNRIKPSTFFLISNNDDAILNYAIQNNIKGMDIVFGNDVYIVLVYADDLISIMREEQIKNLVTENKN